MLRENFEIVGVEKKPNENLKLIVNKILRLISAVLDIENDFISINRCVKTDNIIVKCKNVDIKKLVITGKHGKQLNADQLDLWLTKKVININEHLTPFNKVLLTNAKTLRNKKIFDHAWVNNGYVYVSSATINDNKSIHIYSMEQIKSYSAINTGLGQKAESQKVESQKSQ